MKLRAIAVVPARDEEATLPATLASLREVPALAEIIVVDDGSRDRTPKVACHLGATVVSSAPSGRGGAGKGGALRVGLLHARERRPDAFLLADADLGSSASRLAALLRALGTGRPAAIAAFPPAASGGLGVVKRLARRAIARRTGWRPVEPLSGQRALLTPALEALPGIAPGFGAEVGMTLDLLASGIRPLEIPLPLSHRPTGKSLAGFAHRARQGLDIARALNGARIPW